MAFALLGLLAIACTTQKSKDDLTGLGRLYHNTTAQYNGYFNADILLNQSMANLSNQEPENYLETLPIYPYRNVENPLAEAPNLDNAMEKVSVVVTLHRASDWTDDCYLLLGKAQYLKQDFESAEETFEFLIEEYSPSAMEKKKRDSKASKTKAKKKKKKTKKRKSSSKKKKKKRKKKKRKRKPVKRSKAKPRTTPAKDSKTDVAKQEDNTKEEVEIEDSYVPQTITLGTGAASVEEESENYFLKNPPAYYEGMLWLSRTFIERDRFSDAGRIMNQLTSSKACPEEIKEQIPLQMAYMHYQMGQYATTILELERAAVLTKDKNLKARYLYIAGQLSKQEGNMSKAKGFFDEVASIHPDYEMEFHAILESKQCSSASLNSLEKELLALLKEDKNAIYKDKIYFALAEVAYSNKDREKTIEYLLLAIDNGGKNINQQLAAYYKLGQLYFAEEDYINAKKYYDEALGLMSKKDNRYLQTKGLSESLTEIAANLENIALRDSLLEISKMSDKERRKLAKAIKAQMEEERISKLKNLGSNTKGSASNAALLSKSDFFAYDLKGLKRQQRDFQRRWGNRALEDNWRKSSSSFESVEGPVEEDLSVSSELTDEEFNAYFKDVPKNEEQLAALHKSIKKSMLDLGGLYRNKLNDPEKSVAILKELMRRYPEKSPETIKVYYYLYLAYSDLGDDLNAKKYFDLIQSDYPKSPVALSLKNPNYGKENDKEAKSEDYYEEAFALFESGDVEGCLAMVNQAPSKFGSRYAHKARFDLLKAFCIGKTSGKEEYVDELKQVIKTNPGSPEERQAKEILRLLGAEGYDVAATDDMGNVDKFVTEFNKPHYVIISFEDSKAVLTEAKNQISTFNTSFFKQNRLRATSISLGLEKKSAMIVVRRFNNKEKVMEYLKTIQMNQTDFLKVDSGYQVYAVSQSNYRTILKEKTLSSYPQFFAEHYAE